MAFCAAFFIAGGAYAEIVYGVIFAEINYSAPLYVFFLFPVPMGRAHYFFVPFIMAAYAGFRDLPGGSEFLLKSGELGMVR